MIKFDDITREKIKQHNPNCQQVSHHPYRINSWGPWTWKKKWTSYFNKFSTRYCSDLFIC